MKAILEKVPELSNASLSVQEFRCPHFNIPWHFHTEYELVLILESQGKQFIGDNIKTFHPGDLFLIGSDLPHWFRNDATYYEKDSKLIAASIVIHFKEDLLGDPFLLLPEASAIKRILQEALMGLQVYGSTREKIDKMMRELTDLQGMDKVLHLVYILNTLSKSNEYVTLSSRGTYEINLKDSERINRIYEYVMKHFEKQLSVEEVASTIHICPATFCRFFKKRTRKTFTSFLNEIRIGHACKMLIEEDVSITEICFMSGYNNVSHFNRQFKLLKKMTPKAFKQEYEKKVAKRNYVV